MHYVDIYAYSHPPHTLNFLISYIKDEPNIYHSCEKYYLFLMKVLLLGVRL